MIYLDNAATTFPKPPSVYEAMDRFLRTELGNPGRGGHVLARASESVMHETRFRLARLIGAADPSRIVFTLNGTDSLNMAIKGTLRPGDHVVTGVLEHNSVLRPLAGGEFPSTAVSADAAGTYRIEEIERAIQPETRLVALTHASNVLGSIQPVAEIGALCRTRDVLFLVDAAQTAGSLPIDVEAMKIDLLAAPGHKGLFGPTGTGFLYVGDRVRLTPWREGGTGHDSGSVRQPSSMPEALEAGTPNVAGLVGLREGLRWIESIGVDVLADHERNWRKKLVDRLECMAGVRLLGGSRDAVPVVSFSVDGYSAQEVSAILDSAFGIAVRGGLHCAPRLHEFYGTFPDGAVRVSASYFTSDDAIDALASALTAILSG